MKRAALLGTLVASLAVGSAALADPGGWNRDYDRDRTRTYRVERHDLRWVPPPRVVYRAPSRYGVYYRPYGYYAHPWSRGERLPVAYYDRPYVIGDYYGYGLYEPPRGYHWVRVDGDAVLAAVATGIVLDTVFHAFN